MCLSKTLFNYFAAFLFLQASILAAVPLNVPQTNETEDARNDRMQWFRDAKFGMFVHWGPSSVVMKEIGWGRGANRPHDITEKLYGPRTEDPVYDNYYKQFNPVQLMRMRVYGQ